MVQDFWISFAVMSFICYRISRMIALEEGPFEVFTTLRTFFYEHNAPEWLRRGIICPLCISFWIAIPLAVLMVYSNHYDWYTFFYLWFALSGVASFLYKIEH